MICKTTLERLGKAAFNSLSDEDKKKYVTASNIVALITKIINNGSYTGATVDVGLLLTNIGLEVGTAALITLSNVLTGKEAKTISDAMANLVEFVGNTLERLLDQVKHEIAAKLAVLFGINENPGILGAILEWVYKAVIQPSLA